MELTPRARSRLEGLRAARIGVAGLGREGVDLVRFLAPWAEEIVVSDRSTAEQLSGAMATIDASNVRYVLGKQAGADLRDCDEIFVSPGIPATEPVVAEAVAAGARISSATRLFFEVCPGPIIGITGSSGKTTTTSMVGAMLAEG